MFVFFVIFFRFPQRVFVFLHVFVHVFILIVVSFFRFSFSSSTFFPPCIAKNVHTSNLPDISCDDNMGEFRFDNGAAIHYRFAHREMSKRLEDGIRVHGTRFEDYDVVVVNSGNRPRMEPEELLRVSNELKEQGVPLMWLSTYDGTGDIEKWSDEQRAEFKESGAKFVPIHRMVQSIQYLTKGAIEGESNHHFCMPGPPNEIGILLLQTAWAMRAESERGERVGGRRRH